MAPPQETLYLPTLSAPQTKPSLPLLASLAPIGVAFVLWMVTSSPYTLLFALLGPVVAFAGFLDARRTARRTRKQEIQAARARLAELTVEVEDRHASYRNMLQTDAPPLAERLTHGIREHISRIWRIGKGEVSSPLVLKGEAGDIPELSEQVNKLQQSATFVGDAPIVLREMDEIAIVGESSTAVRALARSLILQAAATSDPDGGVVYVPEGEDWVSELPHRNERSESWKVSVRGETVLKIRTDGSSLPGSTVRLAKPGEIVPHGMEPSAGKWCPEFVPAVTAKHYAKILSAAAEQSGWLPPRSPPNTLPLAKLLAETKQCAPLVAPLGHDGQETIYLDLVAEGPHALVAGTTGSGKSELLVSWVLALASQLSPAELTFLLIDFKGGAAFAPVQCIPHVSGIVSDLDPATANRAVQSLRAELIRRERELAKHGVRSLAELDAGVMPFLVIVVDEFAALVALDPELQLVFADIAARGRTLGMHLILCTQRPNGVVRDGVLANITLRICLRVLDASDSTALIGTVAAATIPIESHGRAILLRSGKPQPVQFALAEEADVNRVVSRWANHPVAKFRPWLDPLPEHLPSKTLPSSVGTQLVIGLVDIPAEQRRAPLQIDPWNAGGLLVVGGASSGRSTALATLGKVARSSGAETRWVSDTAARLWQALSYPASKRTLVLVDDLDRILGQIDEEHRAGIIELLSRCARDTRNTSVALAVSSRTISGAMHTVAASLEQRLLLRLPSREEHVLMGGHPGSFRPARRAGSAIWQGHETQIALAPSRVPAPWGVAIERVNLSEGQWSLATSRPVQWIEKLRALGVTAALIDESPQASAGVLVGDVDSYLGAYQKLGDARRNGRLLLSDCTLADYRALTRSRIPPPPLEVGASEAWLIRGTEPTRVALALCDDESTTPLHGGT